MKSLSSLGIGLSLVFGCLFLALLAELYYLLWWKKRISNREIQDDYSSSARELFYLLCWKKPSSLSSRALDPNNSMSAHGHEANEQLHLHSDFCLKPFGEDGVETELMRLRNPPRFLFTIKEETKEDLESEDAKSRGDKSRKGSRTGSLSDLLLAVETPFLTPLSSPPFFTPPLTPMDYGQHGFNPLFESSTEAEASKIRSSPSPKFKFMKDAEEKLYRRLVLEKALQVQKNGGSAEDVAKAPSLPPATTVVSTTSGTDDEDGSSITIVMGKNKEKELHQHHHLQQHHSSSSQVLPLSSSPANIRPTNKKPMFH